MSRTWKWILIGLGIALVVFLVATAVFSMVFMHGQTGIGRLNYGFAMPHMRIFPFGGMFILGAGLLKFGVLALAVIGVVLLVRNGKNRPLPPAKPVCVSCGKELHAGGEFCPYCGAKQVPPAA